MSDFFEIDFLDVESQKSGDAIPLRYQMNGMTLIHVVDGGFQATGDSVVAHVRKYYGNPSRVDSVVATHPDGDHAGGLRAVLKEFEIGELWMLRPWEYAGEIIHRFENYTSVEKLQQKLKACFPNIAALEEIALERGIPMFEPFQGAEIGEFRVLAPTKARYLDMIVESQKTPEAAEKIKSGLDMLLEATRKVVAKAVNFVRSAWGEEIFAADDTTPENNMSVVQYAVLAGKRILLTADAGRAALAEAADYASSIGIQLPGVDRAQVPHHGSRHNVSTELLDRWFGRRLANKPAPGAETFTAIVSSAKADEDHPRKAVVRAFIHRGARVITTEGTSKCSGHNAPDRPGWVSAQPVEYPEEQEGE